jgi:hypothetical protein
VAVNESVSCSPFTKKLSMSPLVASIAPRNPARRMYETMMTEIPTDVAIADDAQYAVSRCSKPESPSAPILPNMPAHAARDPAIALEAENSSHVSEYRRQQQQHRHGSHLDFMLFVRLPCGTITPDRLHNPNSEPIPNRPE